MKYFISAIMILSFMSSCKHSHELEKEKNSIKKQENIEDVKSDSVSKFPVIGFKKVHEEIIPFSVEKVFPMFEPGGRHLLYDNWEPTVLKMKKKGHLLVESNFQNMMI